MTDQISEVLQRVLNAETFMNMYRDKPLGPVTQDIAQGHIDYLCQALRTALKDTERLNAAECSCRRIDLRFSEGRESNFRWQIDMWAPERPTLRQAIDHNFGKLMEDGHMSPTTGTK